MMRCSPLMPEPAAEREEFDDDDIIVSDEDIAQRPIRVAIVGRPNAGKSTLINHLLGEERLLTSPEAGTTRDSISVEINWQGRDFRVFDTAGLRAARGSRRSWRSCRWPTRCARCALPKSSS